VGFRLFRDDKVKEGGWGHENLGSRVFRPEPAVDLSRLYNSFFCIETVSRGETGITVSALYGTWQRLLC
jgi:hypothetical protein